jgi:Domain of unknown function (DUF3560)
MNDFEAERAAKAARFRQLTKKHENIATGRHFAARERLEMIPLGQPILVGHHSEKRHRNAARLEGGHQCEIRALADTNWGVEPNRAALFCLFLNAFI